jgi:hypothetical protein
MPYISHGLQQDVANQMVYDPGLFSAGGGGSWTVLPADVHTMQYWQFGRFVHIDIDLNGGTVVGNPPFLGLRIPPDISPTTDSGGFLVITPATNPRPGFVSLAAASSIIQLFPISGNWTNGVTPLTFEVSLIIQ